METPIVSSQCASTPPEHGMAADAAIPQPDEKQDASPAVELECRGTIASLYARRNIAAGEIIARISKCMLVTSSVAATSPSVRHLLELGEPFAQDVCLAVFLLAARRGGTWQHHVASMWHGCALHPLFLPADEVDMLRGSFVMPTLEVCRTRFTAEHARLSASLPPGEAGTLDDYLRARSLVMTHAQAIDTAQGQVLAMLPVPAMFSHAPDACARWEDAPQELVLRVRRVIGKGMRLPLSNSGWDRDETLAPLGALFEGEANCQTDIIRPEPPTEWAGKVSPALFGRQQDGNRLFRISNDLDDAAARQLLAYLRVTAHLQVTAADGRADVDEAVQRYIANGKLGPLCRDSELLAMQTLRTACQQRLDAFSTSIQNDDQLLQQNTLSPVQRGIVSLRLREKRILTSLIDTVDVALPLLRKYQGNSHPAFSEYLKSAVAGECGGEHTIFISIASYRDPLLWNTVRECLMNAERPDFLRFGIVDQNDEDASDDLARLPFAQQIRYVNIKPRFSRGACWARSIAFGLYDNEDYLLQIDSHMIFDPGWDRILKMQLEELSTFNSKCILSGYPWGFEIEDGQAVRKVNSHGTLALRLVPDTAFAEDSPVLKFHPLPQPLAAHYYAYELAGGFLFTLGSFVEEVPYDPRLYFHGEEQNLTIRAYTHGWNMFHPRVMPLYHLYKNDKRSEGDTPRHWDEKDNQSRQTPWWKLEEASKRRMSQLVYAEKIKGAYGLGVVRSLDDFAAYSGIDYRHRRLTPRDPIPVQIPPV